jgi:hypothetical protein
MLPLDATHITSGVFAGLLIRAIWTTGSVIVLFTRDPQHHIIHRHHREGHTGHFTACTVGACAEGVGVQEAITA